MTVLDHAFAAVLLVAPALLGGFSWRSLVRAVASGDPDARVRAYRETLAIEWLVTAAILLHWRREGRAWDALGLGLGTSGWNLAVAAAGFAALAAIAAQARAALRATWAVLEPVRSALEELSPMLPSNRRELSWFAAVALTAGIAEEIGYRGFLPWYAAARIGPAAGAALAVLAFGAAHLYQGWRGAAKCTVVGALAMLLFALSGSLLVPIALHAAIDLQGGLVGWRFHRLRAAIGGPTANGP